jgi:iron(III) transport system substrate-binding protein
MHWAVYLAAVCAFGVGIVGAQDSSTEVVNIYSARHYGAMEGTFSRFTEETGIQVRLSQGSVQSLVQRLRAEGAQTPADVFFSIDAGGLDLVASEGLLQPIESAVLMENIPAELRDPDNLWFAFSQRVRTIMYNTQTVDPAELSTYEQLADPMWNGRLCLRPATHIYTISLVGSLVHALGEEAAEEVVRGWVANNPQYIDSDTEILNTIAAGGCDVGITNHYYLARLKTQNPDFPVSVFWANQGEGDRGAFRNVGGAGVTANALNRDNAIRLLEWLAVEGQAADNTGVAAGNYEYPVNPNADILPILETFGEFRIDPMPVNLYGDVQATALAVLERAGYGF